MTAAYLGGTTIGGQVPLLSDTYQALLTALGTTVTALNAQVTAILAAKQAIRIPATSPFLAQLLANQGIQGQLTAQLTNPADYFDSLISGLTAIGTQLAAIPAPEFEADLSLQIANAAAIAALLQEIIDQIDEALALLDVIAEAIQAVIATLNSFLTTNLITYLTTAGVHSFLYEGALAGFGTEANIVTPLSGFPGAAPVRMLFFFVSANDIAAVNALNAIFKVLP